MLAFVLSRLISTYIFQFHATASCFQSTTRDHCSLNSKLLNDLNGSCSQALPLPRHFARWLKNYVLHSQHAVGHWLGIAKRCFAAGSFGCFGAPIPTPFRRSLPIHTKLQTRMLLVKYLGTILLHFSRWYLGLRSGLLATRSPSSLSQSETEVWMGGAEQTCRHRTDLSLHQTGRGWRFGL